MTGKKTLIIVGGNHELVPMVERARKLGLRTVAVDRDSQGDAMRASDLAMVCSTMDFAGVLHVAAEERANGIATMATNLAIRTVARVATALSLPGVTVEAAHVATDKARLREHLEAAGVRMMPGFVASSVEQAKERLEDLRLPVVVKPPDSSGCKGIGIASTHDEFATFFEAARRISRNHEAVVERCSESVVFGVESVIVEGQTFPVLVPQKTISTEGGICTLAIEIPAPDLTPEQVADACSLVAQAHSALGMTMGASHVDLVVDDAGRPAIIDVGPRLGGGPMTHFLAPRLTGVDMVEMVIRQAMGESPPVSVEDRSLYGASHFFRAPRHGILKRVSFPECGDDVYVRIYQTTGCEVSPYGTNVDRLGVVAMVDSDRGRLQHRLATLMSHIEVDFEANEHLPDVAW